MVPVGGIACCFSAAAIYLLGRSSGRDADVLKSVIRVDRSKDLGVEVLAAKHSLRDRSFK